jgi:hypothetical protein
MSACCKLIVVVVIACTTFALAYDWVMDQVDRQKMDDDWSRGSDGWGSW